MPVLVNAQGKPYSTSCIISILFYSTHASPSYNSIVQFKYTVEYFPFLLQKRALIYQKV